MYSTQPLIVERIPDEFGPRLLCRGELTVSTVEALCRELELVVRAGHPALIVDLSAIHLGDIGGSVRMVEALRHLGAAHRQVALVIEPGSDGTPLRALELHTIHPVFASTPEAQAWMRGGEDPVPGPGTWERARDETLERWRAIRATMADQSPNEVLRQLTSLTGLCEQAETEYRAQAAPSGVRCLCCPLFYQSGGGAAQIGCRSVLAPILENVRRGEIACAQSGLGNLIEAVEAMPLPERGVLPPSESVPLPPI